MSRLKGSGREGRNVGNIGTGKWDRAPVDNYRRTLGKRETKSVTSKKERSELVHGSDVALTRSSTRAFFTSTPFLLFLLFLLGAAITLALASFASTPVVRMNEPPINFAKRAAESVRYQQPQAILHQ